MANHRVLTIDTIPGVPLEQGLVWHPLRAELDLRAFGLNGFTAAAAGDDVVEPHSETVHQEIYLVVRGAARFTVGEETFDAAAGSLVVLPDPEVHRHAVATEPDTAVLAVGGPPTFEPSAWEWYVRASAVRATDLAQARAILEDGVREHPESPGIHYELACQLALEGDPEAALTQLRRAAELKPEEVVRAPEDPDLASLHGRADFRELVARAGSAGADSG